MGRYAMIKQEFAVKHYWKVIVYYNVGYNLFDIIAEDCRKAGVSESTIDELYDMMYNHKAKAATYSNTQRHISIVLFNRHKSSEDYLNSIVHEAEHIKQAMLKTYDVTDADEPPAYTLGYLIGRMWEVFNGIVCR